LEDGRLVDSVANQVGEQDTSHFRRRLDRYDAPGAEMSRRPDREDADVRTDIDDRGRRHRRPRPRQVALAKPNFVEEGEQRLVGRRNKRLSVRKLEPVLPPRQPPAERIEEGASAPHTARHQPPVRRQIRLR
jgi:hypothetical protein